MSVASEKEKNPPYIWENVLLFAVLHLLWIYGFYVCYFVVTWKTLIFVMVYLWIGGLGITAGYHRLWSHRAYKATLPLRIFLMICTCMAGQKSIYEWARDHRVHHKYSETTADPHNCKRGFFFAHIGWLLTKKHPLVLEKGKAIDKSDLINDPVVWFNRKFYWVLFPLFCFILPSLVIQQFFGDSFLNGVLCNLHRFMYMLHRAFLVNSVAHMFGGRPYDRGQQSSENWFVSLMTMGEGHHNYHHAFPSDYATSELPWDTNATTVFIDLCAKLGLAYDLKKVSPENILKRRQRTGDLMAAESLGNAHHHLELMSKKTLVSNGGSHHLESMSNGHLESMSNGHLHQSMDEEVMRDLTE